MNNPAAYLCVHCWPAGNKAAVWDGQGLPCCYEHANNENKPSCPGFVLDHIREREDKTGEAA